MMERRGEERYTLRLVGMVLLGRLQVRPVWVLGDTERFLLRCHYLTHGDAMNMNVIIVSVQEGVKKHESMI